MDLKRRPVTKAIFPVAGLGTRFLPATKAHPKEMLTVVNKPLIQYAVEEAYAAGIREMIFVTCHNKRSIEDHFDISYELEEELLTQNKVELLALIRAIKPADMSCFYVRQPKAMGLGQAVLIAEKLICDEPFAVILADDLILAETPVIQQMLNEYNENGHCIIAVQEIPLEQTNQYGIVDGEFCDSRLTKITSMIEKPQPEVAPSQMGIVGRYILKPEIFPRIRALPTRQGEEIQLTDAIKSLIKTDTVLAYCYEGKRYDCGSILGFLKANVDLGKMHPTEGQKFTQWLSNSLTNQPAGR